MEIESRKDTEQVVEVRFEESLLQDCVYYIPDGFLL